MPITIPRRITSVANRVLDDGDFHDGGTIRSSVTTNDDNDDDVSGPLEFASGQNDRQPKFSSTVVESNPTYPLPTPRGGGGSSGTSGGDGIEQQQPKQKAFSEPTFSPNNLGQYQYQSQPLPQSKVTKVDKDGRNKNSKSSSSRPKICPKHLIRKTFFLFRGRNGRRMAKEVPVQQQQPQQKHNVDYDSDKDGETSLHSMSQMGYSVQDLEGYDEYNHEDDEKSHWDIDSLSNAGRTRASVSPKHKNKDKAAPLSPSSKASHQSIRSSRKDVSHGNPLLQRQKAIVLCRPSTANLMVEEEQEDIICEMPSLLRPQTSFGIDYGSDSESNVRRPKLVRELSGLTQNTFDMSWADPFEIDQPQHRTTKGKNSRHQQQLSPSRKQRQQQQQQHNQNQRHYSLDSYDDVSVSSDPGGKCGLVAVEFEFSLDDDHDDGDHYHTNAVRILNSDDHDDEASYNNYLQAPAAGGSGGGHHLLTQSEPHHSKHMYQSMLRYGTTNNNKAYSIQRSKSEDNEDEEQVKPTSPMAGPTTSSGSVGLIPAGFSSLRDPSLTPSPTKAQMMYQQHQMNSSSLQIPMPSHYQSSSSNDHHHEVSSSHLGRKHNNIFSSSPNTKSSLFDDDHDDHHNSNSVSMMQQKPKSPSRVTFQEQQNAEEESSSPSLSQSPNKSSSPNKSILKQKDFIHYPKKEVPCTKLEPATSTSTTSSLEPLASFSSSDDTSPSATAPRRRISASLETIITDCPPSPPTKRNSAYKTNSNLSLQVQVEEVEKDEEQPKDTDTSIPSPPPLHHHNLTPPPSSTRNIMTKQHRSPRRGLEDDDDPIKPILPLRRTGVHSHVVRNNNTSMERPDALSSRAKTT